jgi:hypothetical protein
MVWQLILAPTIERWEVVMQRLTTLATLRNRLSVQVASLDTAEARLAVALQAGQTTPGLMGVDGAEAVATLQRLVQERLLAAGGELHSLLVLPPRADGAFTRLSLRVEVTTPAHVIGDLLLTLRAETSPLIHLDNIEIRAASSQPSATQPTIVRARIDLYALARKARA